MKCHHTRKPREDDKRSSSLWQRSSLQVPDWALQPSDISRSNWSGNFSGEKFFPAIVNWKMPFLLDLKLTKLTPTGILGYDALQFGERPTFRRNHTALNPQDRTLHSHRRENLKLNWNIIFTFRIYSLFGAGIATGYGLDDRGVGDRVPVEARSLSSPRRADRIWGLPSLLSNGYRGIFPRE
jgi:hypothetical protein